MNQILQYRLSADSHRGMQRTGNEDAFALFELPGCDAAFVVADGMGGLQAGDRASQEAVRVIQQSLRQRIDVHSGPAELASALRESFGAANEAVLALSSARAADPEEPTQDFDHPPAGAPGLMGTTAVAGILKDGALHLAHAGDSRAYRLRNGELERLTEDHSFVAERVKAGDMTETEARRSRYRNMVTRAIGIDRTVAPDLRSETLQPGDQYLICTDGLTTMVDDSEIARQVAAGLPPERLVPALIDAANRNGGTDNITVLILSALRPGESPVPQPLRTPVPEPVPAGRRSAEVLDLDTPARPARRRRAAGPAPLTTVLAILGVGALLLIFALTLSDTLRLRLADRLAGKPTTPPVVVRPPNYANLIYNKPERFTEAYLARNDRLAYAPGKGLYLISSGEGKVLLLNARGERAGKPLKIPVSDKQDVDAAPKPDEIYLATDPDGDLYVSSPARRVIEKFDIEGRWLTRIGPEGLAAPRAIAVDEEGNVFVVDSGYILRASAYPRPAPSPAAKR